MSTDLIVGESSIGPRFPGRGGRKKGKGRKGKGHKKGHHDQHQLHHGYPEHHGQKRHKRHKKHKKRLGALIGPTVAVDDESAAIMNKYATVYKQYEASNSPAHSAYNSLLDIQHSFGDLDPDTTQISHAAQRIILGSYTHKTPVYVHFKAGDQEVEVQGTANPLEHEGQISIDMPFAKADQIFIDHDTPISFEVTNARGDLFTYDDLLSTGAIFEYPQTLSGVTSTHPSVVSVPLSLYDDALHPAYSQHKFPTPRAVVTMQATGPKKPLKVRGIRLVLDLEPSPDKNVHVAGVPVLAGTDTEPIVRATPAHVHETVSGGFADMLYDKCIDSLSAEISHSDWVFASSGGKISHPEHNGRNAYWGEVTQTAVAYTVMSLLQMTDNPASNLMDPEFLIKTLEVDETGQKIVKHIKNLSSAFNQQSLSESAATSSGKGKEEQRRFQYNEEGTPLFPSLYQLLTHTSGLPETQVQSCSDILKMYEETISNLQKTISAPSSASSSSSSSSGPREELSGSSSGEDEGEEMQRGDEDEASINLRAYVEQENAFMEYVMKLTQLENVMGSFQGRETNSTEACLIAMFIRRHTMAINKFPEETINETLARLKVSLDWARHPEKRGDSFVFVNGRPSPYNLIECASSSIAGLQKYTENLLGELQGSAAQQSIFAKMLSVSTAQVGEPESSSRSFGWYKEKINKQMTLHYIGDAFAGMNTVLIGMIPELNWWFTFVEHAFDKDTILSKSVASLVPMIVDIVSKNPSLPAIPIQIHAQPVHMLENSKYARTVDNVKVRQDFNLNSVLPKVGERTFVSPFTDRYTNALPTLTLSVDSAYPTSRIELETANGPLRKTYHAVYDHKRDGFYEILDNSNKSSPLGDRILIDLDTPSVMVDDITYLGIVAASKILRDYKQTLEQVRTVGKSDVFDGPASQVAKEIQAPVPRSLFFEIPETIGGHGLVTGALLGAGVLGAGALAASALVRPWGGYYGPGYGYGYGGYYGPGYGYYGPGYGYGYGYGGWRHGHRHGHHHGGHHGRRGGRR